MSWGIPRVYAHITYLSPFASGKYQLRLNNYFTNITLQKRLLMSEEEYDALQYGSGDGLVLKRY